MFENPELIYQPETVDRFIIGIGKESIKKIVAMSANVGGGGSTTFSQLKKFFFSKLEKVLKCKNMYVFYRVCFILDFFLRFLRFRSF